MSDCSGSHCFDVPFAEIDLIDARRSPPPIASTARLTRLCSFVGGVVAQDSRTSAALTASARFMALLLPRMTESEQSQSATIPNPQGPENCSGSPDVPQAKPDARRPPGLCGRRHRADCLGVATAERAFVPVSRRRQRTRRVAAL